LSGTERNMDSLEYIPMSDLIAYDIGQADRFATHLMLVCLPSELFLAIDI
jgi:hypothetical protein